jgi:aryl-alcohol dehydrogenase-like predicted oxidoreductase
MPKVRRPIRPILFHNAAENQIDPREGAVAVAWTLCNPAVNGAIVGFRRPEQVDPLVAAVNLTLDKQDIATILRRK